MQECDKVGFAGISELTQWISHPTLYCKQKLVLANVGYKSVYMRPENRAALFDFKPENLFFSEFILSFLK